MSGDALRLRIGLIIWIDPRASPQSSETNGLIADAEGPPPTQASPLDRFIIE